MVRPGTVSAGMSKRFPSMKAKDLLAVLTRKPLAYQVVRHAGSHRRLEAEGRPPLVFAFHDRQTCPPGLVRKILTVDIGLGEDEALAILSKRRCTP